MFQIVTQPQDTTVLKNTPWSLSTTVSGGVQSDSRTELYDGNNFTDRAFIIKGSGSNLYSSAYKSNGTFEMKTSNTNGYSWANYTLPDIGITYPSAGLKATNNDIVIGTGKLNAQNYFIVNQVVMGYAFSPVLGLVNVAGGTTVKIGGFLGKLDTLTSGLLCGQRSDGSWFNYAGIGTDVCPNSWVSTNDGANWLFTLSSMNIGSLNTGVFQAVKNFDNYPTRKLDIRGKLSLCRVSPTRIVMFEFNGAVSAQYSDNSGTTWSTYTNLPPLTTMFNMNSLYVDGHCYISSMTGNKTVYHSYMDGPWEAIELTELSAGSIAIPMSVNTAGKVLFSAVDSTSAKILQIDNSVSYEYSLFKSPDTTPIDTVITPNESYTYSKPNAVIADSGDYYITIKNDATTLTSDTATVLVTDAFRIVNQPYDQEIAEGQSFTIICNVEGGDTNVGYTFKVYKDNVLISTVTQTSGVYSYGRSYAVVDDSGTYRVEVTNVSTTLVSENAIIIVNPKGVDKPTWTHDDNIIIDKSLTNFKLSPIEKCYNEFVIDWHKFGDNNLGQITITNIEQDEFPPYSDGQTQWLDPTSVSIYYGENGLYTTDGAIIYVTLQKPADATLIAQIDANLDIGWKWTVRAYGNLVTLETDRMEIDADRTSSKTYRFARTGGTAPESTSNYYFYLDSVQMENTAVNNYWKDFVIGVDDYTSAKDLWDRAKNSYTLNKRIRKAPADRTQLEYAIETNFLDGPKTNTTKYPQWNTASIDYDEYAFKYTQQLVEWSTKQKLQVSYSVPITTDTIKIELMDNIFLSDPIITPAVGEYGKGWVTSIQLDPKKNQIKLTVTFEVLFFIPPTIIDQCGDIWERGYNTIDIIETGSQPDNILEGECPYN